VAFSYAVTTDVANDAVLRHNCDPVAAHILGRALTAGVLSSSLLDGPERLNLRWSYQGELRTLLVDAGSDQSVRGFLSPPRLQTRADQVEELFGEKGEIQVVRSRGGNVLNSGSTEAWLQDVVRDLAFYYSFSEQVETAMSIMIAFNRDVQRPVSLCQGIILQALPSCDPERFQRMRERLHEPACREQVQRPSQADNHFENIINLVVQDEGGDPRLRLEEGRTPRFRCTCSREKMGAVLRTLPYDERVSIVQAGEDVPISCHFCNTRYVLTVEECIRAWNHESLET
jgi:molecular chaperone Hsp33